MVAPLSLTCLVLFELFVLSRSLETSNPLVIPLSVAGPHLLHPVHGSFPYFSILALMLHIFLFLRWRVHGPANSTARSTCRPKLSIFARDFSWLLASLAVVAQFSSVFVVVDTIDESHLCQTGGPVSVARLSVQFSGSGDLLWGGWRWFWSRWLLFLFLGSTLLFTSEDGLAVLHIPLVFTLSRQFRILVGHTEQNWFLSREFFYIYRFARQS